MEQLTGFLEVIHKLNHYLVSVSQLLGVWISEDLSWANNGQQICRKAYSRMSIITKLKYVGVIQDDLIDIYILFIWTVTEYCVVSFHSSLTVEQSGKLERIQKTCLKVILGDLYEDYESALELLGLTTLSKRREKRCLDFTLPCLKNNRTQRLFPRNPSQDDRIRLSEPYLVNFAKTSTYKKSAIPYCQRLLNKHLQKIKHKKKIIPIL